MNATKLPRKPNLCGENSNLLKLFINGYERCPSTQASLRIKWNSIFKCKKHTTHDARGPEKYNNTRI